MSEETLELESILNWLQSIELQLWDISGFTRVHPDEYKDLSPAAAGYRLASADAAFNIAIDNLQELVHKLKEIVVK